MDFIIKRKITICMLFIAISMLGYVSYKHLKVEMLPNAELPMLYIQVSSRQDVNPAYMESQVIIPLEGVVSTIEGVARIESEAGNRSGRLQVDFNKGMNLKYTILKLQERVNNLLPTLPEGFSYAGDVYVGGFDEKLPCYTNENTPEWVYVYQEVTTDGTVDEHGTLNRTEPHMAYVRYVVLELRGKSLIMVNGKLYVSLWTAGNAPYYEEKYGVRTTEEPKDAEYIGNSVFCGKDSIPQKDLEANFEPLEVYLADEVLYVGASWFTWTAEEDSETQHFGYDIFIPYEGHF